MVKPGALALIMILTAQLGVLVETSHGMSARASDSTPVLIRQGPMGISQISSGDPYWFQTGALGDSASSNYVAASVLIRTAYDKVSNDAHSYWVGGSIANGAFVQVGFLNEVSTTNQPFCCAWFFEYFYAPPNDNCCLPIIGPEGSAGPIGSWHNYTMTSNGSGSWSFYMDAGLLGSTPNLGGPSAASSGGNAPGTIAEVAAASSNTDILGPGEFKDLRFRTAGSAWQSVPSAKSLIWYGRCNGCSPPPNPYGAEEVEGVDNDFLVGSNIPPLNSPTAPGNPSPSLWPVSKPPNSISFTFSDADGTYFQPSWVSLREQLGFQIFYTQYTNQLIPNGSWSVGTVMWHSVNVTLPTSQFVTPSTNSEAVRCNAFSIKLHVVGLVSGLPVRGATVTTFFGDTLSEAVVTDGSGNATLGQLPLGSYVLRIKVPYGIGSIVNQNVTGTTQLTARVLSTVEMFLIIALPIIGAVTVVLVAVWRDRLLRASMPTIPPSYVAASNCTKCGHLLHATDSLCPNCGTPVKPLMT